MALRVIWQYMDRSVTQKILYGPKLLRVIVVNATFNNISVILWRTVFWWRKPEYPEKTTDLSQVTKKQCYSEYTSQL